jgi:Flp pilus assembly pilin Flp
MHEKTTHETEHAQNVACEERGQTMAEYGVVLGVITLGAILAFTALGGSISGAINGVVSRLPK